MFGMVETILVWLGNNTHSNRKGEKGWVGNSNHGNKEGISNSITIVTCRL